MKFRIFRSSDVYGVRRPHPEAVQDGEDTPILGRHDRPAKRWYISFESLDSLLLVTDSASIKDADNELPQAVIGRKNAWFENEIVPVIMLYDSYIE